MPRPRRADETGGLNRGNGRLPIFWKNEDYLAFERILSEGLDLYEVSLFSFQLMPKSLAFGVTTAEGRRNEPFPALGERDAHDALSRSSEAIGATVDNETSRTTARAKTRSTRYQ